MKRQTRNAVLMAAAAGGLLADGVKGAPLVDISILACPTQNGVYSSTLQVTAGQTYYYEIIGQLAPVGTDNSHADITSITPGTDGISSLYMNFYDSASAANGISFSTISNALATPSTTPAAAQNWAGGTGAMTATVQNYSGGTDNELLGVRPVGGNATLTAAAAPDVLYIGTFTIGSAPASSSQVVGQWDGSNFDPQSLIPFQGPNSDWSATPDYIASSAGPALATVGQVIYMVWKGMNSDQGIYSAIWDGLTWSQPEPVTGVGASSVPALCVVS